MGAALDVAIVRAGPSPGRCILPPVQNVSIPKHA
jgi:hypothetical protein